jgi:succinoglycan biosynthesis transport protein ExoP
MDAEFEEEYKSLSDYVVILKRRRYQLLVPAAIVILLTVFFAVGLPAKYTSTATILIEEQAIPRDLVRSTITSFAAQQIQVITQRVMTVDNIHQIVRKYNLYEQGEGKARLPRTELALMFSESVDLDLVSASVIDPRSGRPTDATIAFTLSFEDRSPDATQKVANELVSLYLNENLRTRAVKASGATDFLSGEAAALNNELMKQESVLATFKENNEGALPELYQFNLSVVERTEREFSDTNLRIQELQKRVIQLAAQLTQLSPSAPVILASGAVVLSDADRLDALQSEYRKKSALYHDNHPDLKRLTREISVLQAVNGDVDTGQDIQKQLQAQRDELASLQQRYTADHVKVVRAKKVMGELQAKLDNIDTTNAGLLTAAEITTPDNPTYVLLDTQLKASRAEIQSLNSKKITLNSKINEYEQLIKRAPAVEKGYQALLRDYQTTGQKYQDLRAKLREAEVSKNLEKERKGEHFTLIEPPALPLTPTSPNRIAIIMVGFILAIAAGVGYVVILEAMDGSIRGAKALTKVMGVAPFVVIPYLENGDDTRVRAKRRSIAVSIAATMLLISIIYTHFYFKPLDVLWFVILQRAGLS